MNRPRDLTDRARDEGELRRVNPDGFLRETFTLPVEDARAKAREFLSAFPAGGYMTIVEKWRQRPPARSNLPCGGCLRQTD